VPTLSPDTLLKAIAEPTRLRIVLLLQQYDELCVCHLQDSLDLAQPKISRHLKTLRESGIVMDRREGQWVHYRLNPAMPAWAQAVIQGLAVGAEAEGVLQPMSNAGKPTSALKSCSR